MKSAAPLDPGLSVEGNCLEIVEYADITEYRSELG